MRNSFLRYPSRYSYGRTIAWAFAQKLPVHRGGDIQKTAGKNLARRVLHPGIGKRRGKITYYVLDKAGIIITIVLFCSEAFIVLQSMGLYVFICV